MCGPSHRQAVLQQERPTNKFVQPPTHIDLMFSIGGFQQTYSRKSLGVFFLTAIAICLGCFASYQAPVLASNPGTFGLLLLGCSLLVSLLLGKLRWETVISCAYQVDEAVTKVSSSQTLTRITSCMSTSSTRLVELAKGTGCRWAEAARCARTVERRTHQISAPEPFLSVEKIAELSLSDLKDLMRFALDVNRLDFQSQAFLSTLHPGAREATEAINQVVTASRGPKTALSTPSFLRGGDVSGIMGVAANMDALSFAAAVRVYAEWRSLRLVPDGYQRYAVAMNLAKRDLLQNVQKIETAAQNWMASREDSRQSAVDLANGRQVSSTHACWLILAAGMFRLQSFRALSHSLCFALQSTSPTLRQLLIWEKEQNFHPRLPRLADKSGASGLLWILRQLQYQTSVFQNLIQVPLLFPSAKMAVLSAYKATYSEYHGFLVKQIFQNSFDAAPPAHEILEHMSLTPKSVPENQDTVTEAMTDDDEEEDYFSIQDSIDSKGMINDKQVLVKTSLNPFADVARHIVNEWMKLERFMSQCTGKHAEPDPSRNILDTTSLNFVERTTSIAKKPSAATFSFTQIAEEEIPSHVAAVEPILQGLDKLIRDLNMNDPSKC